MFQLEGQISKFVNFKQDNFANEGLTRMHFFYFFYDLEMCMSCNSHLKVYVTHLMLSTSEYNIIIYFNN